MQRKSGLYTEIVFTMTLVVGAALVFGGFLLLRLTERELLEQKVQSSRQMAEFVARAVTLPDVTPQAPPNSATIKAMMEDFGPALESWQIYDRYSKNEDDHTHYGVI